MSRPVGSSPIVDALEPIGILLIGMIGFVGWAIHAGPDLNWDLLNYHVYAGLHADGHALSRDFFAATSVGYMAPYGYWPLAAMIAAKWPAIVVGSVVAAIHSLAFIASWYLAKQMFPDATREAMMMRVGSAVLAVVCALVLTEAGTSFIDITAAIPVVLGVALFIRASRETEQRLAVWLLSGGCFGVAVALKLTSGPFACAAFLSLALLACLRPGVRWVAVLIFAIGGAAGFVAGYGYWGLLLWREFGNPFYPFFHSLFVPPPALPEAIANVSTGSQPSFQSSIWDWLFSSTNRHLRFMPRDLWDWLLRPLFMLDPVANVYTEVRAPDARFLALFCIAPVALWKSRGHPIARGLTPLLLLFFIGWVGWMATTGNGRYLMPWALIVGPALVACASACWPRPGLTAALIISLFVCVQAVSLWEGAQFRWAGSEWQVEYISARLPRELIDRPVTFVSFDAQSASWLSAFVHPESRFANPGGPAPKPAPGKDTDRFTWILSQSRSIFAVFKYNYVEAKSGMPYPGTPGRVDDSAAWMGLLVDTSSCLSGIIVEKGPGLTAEIVRMGSQIELRAVQGYFFCPAVYQPSLRRTLSYDPIMESAFANVERACPRQFPPGGAYTICAGKACSRVYGTTDTELNVAADGAVTSRFYGAVQRPYLGKVADLARDASNVKCHENLGRYRPWSPGETILPAAPARSAE